MDFWLWIMPVTCDRKGAVTVATAWLWEYGGILYANIRLLLQDL